MSKIFVDQVDPKTGTTLTLGTSGDTVNIPSGVTLANAGTVTGLLIFFQTNWFGIGQVHVPPKEGFTCSGSHALLSSENISSPPVYRVEVVEITILLISKSLSIGFTTVTPHKPFWEDSPNGPGIAIKISGFAKRSWVKTIISVSPVSPLASSRKLLVSLATLLWTKLLFTSKSLMSRKYTFLI